MTHDRLARLATLADEIATVRLDAACPYDVIVSDARRLLDVDSIGIYSVVEGSAGFEFDRYHVDSDPDARIKNGMMHLFSQRDVPVLFYDVACPAPSQRNRLIEATALIDSKHPGGWKATALCTDVLEPLGLGHQQQHRILLSERGSLLAWFGAFHDGPLASWQQRALLSLARPLRHRLRTERRLCGSPRSLAALDAALSYIAAPAFIIQDSGAIMTANAAGLRLLESPSSDVRQSLIDALRGRCTAQQFDITEIRDPGVPTSWLAVARPAPEVIIGTALARAQVRWRLTTRQAQVLALLLRGASNTAIAAELGVSTRSIEQHVTGLLGRGNVGSRAALVATVLAI